MQTGAALLQPKSIGDVPIRNRIVRAATSETLADADGFIKLSPYRELYRRLAAGGTGLLFTGHCFVTPRGKYNPGMAGLDSDDKIEPFRAVVEAVRKHGAKIFVELNHAGGQSRVATVTPLAPSPVDNPQTHRRTEAATEAEIEGVIAAYGAAARRARAAGFDGIHLHAGHGYLLSEFLSPYSNRRQDAWGGSLANRQRLLMAIVEAVVEAAPGLPVTVKLGMRDFVAGGLSLDDALSTGEALEAAGVAAIEVSAGLTTDLVESVRQYAGLTRRRALEDKLIHRVIAPTVGEGIFAAEARRLSERVRIPVILVGGLRSVEFMASVIEDGTADFVSLGRPLIREPELVRSIERGRAGVVDCTSCNICAIHEGVHSLRCWRATNRLLARHAVHRILGHLSK